MQSNNSQAIASPTPGGFGVDLADPTAKIAQLGSINQLCEPFAQENGGFPARVFSGGAETFDRRRNFAGVVFT
jgi:hypothetical protein